MLAGFIGASRVVSDVSVQEIQLVDQQLQRVYTYDLVEWIKTQGKIDFTQHCDYIHSNPVHHQLCQVPTDWQFSSVHRFIAQGFYPPNWVIMQLISH